MEGIEVTTEVLKADGLCFNGKPLSQRDTKRLEKPAFKTMIPPSCEETESYLRGWRQPSTAYILFETVQYHILSEGLVRKGTGLLTFSVEARCEHMEWKLREYQKKGYRIIHYANFPKLDDRNPERAKRAKLYSGPNGQNPWDALEKEVKGLMDVNPGVSEKLKAVESERDEYKAKFEAMSQRLEKDKAKNGAKPTRDTDS